MRLDVFLKQSRLIPRRTVAQEICDAGAVTVNGHPGKPGKTVSEGDVLVMRYRGRETTARVLATPVRAPSKADARSIVEIVSVESYE